MAVLDKNQSYARKVVLPRYGFEGSPKALAAVIAPWQSHSCSLQGVFDMLQQFDRPEISSNAELLQQGAVLNDLLFGEMGPPAALQPQAAERQSKAKTRAPPPARTAAPVRDVEVLVRHAVQEDHPANEEALLTVKSNATMKSVKEDNEKLNGRRALLVLGIPSLRPAGEEPAEDVPAEKGLQASVEPRSKPEVKVAVPEPPKLSISQALALQRDLLQGFSDPEFQQKRK
ncbi:unnamed protein product, partial [Symbiodinium microadriaticum]